MVPATGLEPVRCYSLEPESSASANSATRAHRVNHAVQEKKIRTSGVPCKREVHGGKYWQSLDAPLQNS
jgi:hypothetical protein